MLFCIAMYCWWNMLTTGEAPVGLKTLSVHPAHRNYLQRVIQLKNTMPIQSVLVFEFPLLLETVNTDFTHHFCSYLSQLWMKVNHDQANNHDCPITQFLKNNFALTADIILDLRWHLVAASWQFGSLCSFEWTSIWDSVWDRKLTAFCSSDFLYSVYLS